MDVSYKVDSNALLAAVHVPSGTLESQMSLLVVDWMNISHVIIM